jgi:hypothetical protein
MLLPIRRPVRPEPLPLRERAPSATPLRPAPVWLSVRSKRHRSSVLTARRMSPGSRGPFSGARR